MAGDTVVFDGTSGGGTIVVCGTAVANCPNGSGVVTITSLTMGAFTGTLDFATRNPNVTLTANAPTVSLTGTGTRTLSMGNGTWTLSGTLAGWDNTTVTNETLNANSSTINFSATASVGARSMIGGASKAYNIVTISAPSTFLNDAPFSTTGSFTIATLNLTGPNWIRLGASSTLTITNAFTWTGTATAPFILDGGTGGTATISSANNGTIAFGVPTGLTFSGGGTFTCTSCFNMGTNTGITITAPTGSGGGIISG